MARGGTFVWDGCGQGAGPPKGKKLKIMMKSAWGSDDPTRASFPFVHGLALAEAGHDVQIFLIGGDQFDAKGDGECDLSGGVAPAEGDPRKGGGKTHSDLLLRSLLPGPWGHGNRLEQLRSKIRNPGNLCLVSGMGGPSYHRMTRG